MSSKMIVWALFDSGNGCYSKGVKELNLNNETDIDIYPIGIDIENKNNHFINLNLADYGRIFGDNTLFDELDKLPKPDLIIASPPCESWSNASAMANGNACWKQEDLSDSLFSPQTEPSKFTVREYIDYERYQFKPFKSLIKRINGELTVLNTIEIIKRYRPKFYIIENPAYGRIWDYIDKILGFYIEYDNLTFYNNYDYPVKKPTKFKSNICLKLKTEIVEQNIAFRDLGRGYNERSNIPMKLVKEIFLKVYKEFENDKNLHKK